MHQNFQKSQRCSYRDIVLKFILATIFSNFSKFTSFCCNISLTLSRRKLMVITLRTSNYCEELAIPGMHPEDPNTPSGRCTPCKRLLKVVTRRSHQDSHSVNSASLNHADSYRNNCTGCLN